VPVEVARLAEADSTAHTFEAPEAQVRADVVLHVMEAGRLKSTELARECLLPTHGLTVNANH